MKKNEFFENFSECTSKSMTLSIGDGFHVEFVVTEEMFEAWLKHDDCDNKGNVGRRFYDGSCQEKATFEFLQFQKDTLDIMDEYMFFIYRRECMGWK